MIFSTLTLLHCGFFPVLFACKQLTPCPVMAGASKEQGASSGVHWSSQHGGLESNARERSCLSSACPHNGLYSPAVSQINVLISEMTCPENNLVKKDEFSDPPHNVLLPQPRCLHTAVCYIFKGGTSLKVSPGFVCYWSKASRSSCSDICVAHMSTIWQGSVG